MKKILLPLIFLSFFCLNSTYSYAEEYTQFDIRYGMHERIVNKKYGSPILVEKIKIHPIPKKRALYQLGESDYMILYFFSGRIYKITLLEDMALDKATAIFSEGLR